MTLAYDSSARHLEDMLGQRPGGSTSELCAHIFCKWPRNNPFLSADMEHMGCFLCVTPGYQPKNLLWENDGFGETSHHIDMDGFGTDHDRTL